MTTFRIALFAIVLASAAGKPVVAQGTAADYQRSADIGKQLSSRVYRAAVTPHWIDADRFWYRNDLQGGRREFWLIDAATSSRVPAIDYVRLSKSLGALQHRQLDPGRLPVDTIAPATVAGKPLIIQVGTHSYECNSEYGLKEVAADLGRAAAFPPDRGPRVSGSSADETSLTFVNQTDGEIHLVWLDTEGKSVSYGTVARGARREMHTYVTHLWRVDDSAGHPLGIFQAGKEPQLAVVTGVVQRTTSERRRRGNPPVAPVTEYRASIRNFNIVLVDKAGHETQLTTDGTAGDRYQEPLVWSADGSRLLALKTVPEQEHKVFLVESSPTDQLQPKVHINQYLKPGDNIDHPRVHLFDIGQRKEIAVSDQLMPQPWSIDNIEWDADSKRYTVLYNQRGHQVMRLVSINPNSGETTAVIDEHAPTFIDWTNKVYLHRINASHEAIWMSERDGWNHLYLYDTATGAIKNQITKGNWVVRGVDRIDDAKRIIFFHTGGIVSSQDPYYLQYAKVNFDGSGLTLLTEGDGTHSVEYSPSQKYLIDTYSRVDLAPISVLRNAATGAKITDIEHGDSSALLSAGYKLPERFVAKARDGVTDIYGVICRPTNFNPHRKYPVIENIYAGPQGSFVPKQFGRATGLQAMAELGFIVVQLDGLGTNNRSKAFHDVCWKNLADAGFPDRILWIKAAVSKYPYIDLSRVGIYGTSAGGQNALGGMLLHGDFYKVGMADCGCHDNRMDKIWWNEQWMGWPIGPEYAASSNTTYASRLTGKLLLMVGEMDTNVDPSSTMQVVNALIKANKDFELLVMPGAGHGVAGTPYGRRRLQDFMVRNLLGAEPRRSL